jgi:hypothetical protein
LAAVNEIFATIAGRKTGRSERIDFQPPPVRCPERRYDSRDESPHLARPMRPSRLQRSVSGERGAGGIEGTFREI